MKSHADFVPALLKAFKDYDFAGLWISQLPFWIRPLIGYQCKRRYQLIDRRFRLSSISTH
ncbi:hypothetical protein A5906_26330 [Bradyrhizobium sacchari]|uniref:hypothetical protein n=1 Tax=Bradyrhizobium sacchari TaxID=1399419 RepID=UPI0009AFC605|nr:hypothetical protein [Bradyrhizobium sacchari]OPY99247.1 hypothetical protein A5906_26330 [Bradyrhizobium sacchari]